MKDEDLNYLQRFVSEQVSLIPGRKSLSGSSIFIVCPFHADVNPSCSINLTRQGRTPGGFYCFGCGAKGPWNDLAEHFGLEKMTQDSISRSKAHVPMWDFTGLREDLLSSKEGMDNLHTIYHNLNIVATIPLPNNTDWRGIPYKVLKKMHCELGIDKWSNQKLIIPTMVNKEIVGGISARLVKSKKGNNYTNSRGAWTKRRGLLGFDQAVRVMKKKGLSTVVLVEGPRDQMRFLRYGLPVMAILGIENWTEAKRDLILALEPDRVIPCMDDDEQGIRAQEKIVDGFGKYVDVRPFYIGNHAKKRGYDPGNVPKSIIKELKTRLV